MRSRQAKNSSESTPRLATVGTACLSVLLGLLLIAAPAQAARVHTLLLNETLPEALTPAEVAVNQGSHHFYVVSQNGSNPARGKVFNFAENGQIDAVAPELPRFPPFAAGNVAVDNSGAGYVYLSEEDSFHPGSGRVQQFAPTGAATSVTITQASIPPNGTPQTGGLPPVLNEEEAYERRVYFRPRAIAVSGSGNLFVVENEAGIDSEKRSIGAIDEFTEDGEFVAQLAVGDVGPGTHGIALDSSGHIYVASEAAPFGRGLFELDASTGECVPLSCEPIDPARALGVAIDQADGKVFTTGVVSELRQEGKFSEYDATTGELLGVTRVPELHLLEGIAVQEGGAEPGGIVLADSRPEGEGTVKVFSAVKVVPDVTNRPPEELPGHLWRYNGEIGAAGIAGATCVFQYVADADFQVGGFEGAQEAPCQPAGPFEGTGLNAVHADISDLRGGTTYHERLLGSNENGSNPSEAEEFTTKGPTVTGTEAVGVTEAAATLKGYVNPNGAATVYRFQYLTQAQYEANPPSARFDGAADVPAGGGAIGAGNAALEVAQRVEGLTAGTVYRFRIVAVSSGAGTAGETEGETRSFSTYRAEPAFGPCPNESFRLRRPSGALPDCRAYEQASPTVKNGASVEGEFNAVAASPDGSGITFFVSSGIPGGEGEQEFPTYLATRAADGSGWSTQGLLPPASAGVRAQVLGWTEDLSEAYDFATQAFEGARLLVRRSADRSLVEVGSIASSPFSTPFAFAGASTGGSVALLESEKGGLLPEDRIGKQNVYAYERDTGTLVMAGVMNNGTVPSGGAMAGSYSWYQSNRPNENAGALNHYFTQAQHAISSDGKKIFFTAGESGQLYVRVNPFSEPVELDPRECLEGAKACTVRVSAPEEGVADPETPAAFVGANADGTVVYFLDSGKLTDDATGGSGYDLYRFDLGTDQLTDLTLDTTDGDGARVEGLLGLSDSGEDAYFVAAGKLSEDASHAPVGETNLYALHGNAINFITRLGTGANEALNWTPRSRESGGQEITRTSRLSADGKTLLFRSQRQLDGYDNRGVAELYLYHLGQGILCISCNPTGEAPLGPSGVQDSPTHYLPPKPPSPFLTHNLSADGNRVIFDSVDRLVAADHNEVNDIYEWEAPDAANPADSCHSEGQNGGCLYLISSGAEDAEPSYFADADREGNNAFFFTSDQLVAQDKDKLVDIYDARVDGGIAAQEAMTLPSCGSEMECRPSVGEAPTGATPASPSAKGVNVKPVAHCRKGKVRRHGRCLSMHKKHHRKHTRQDRRRHQGQHQQHKNGKVTHHPKPGQHKRAKGGSR